MIHGALERCDNGLLVRGAVMLLLIVASAIAVHAQPPASPNTPPSDTTRPVPTDSLTAADTLAGNDSLHDGHDHGSTPSVRRPVRDIGAPLGALAPAHRGSGYELIPKNDLVWEPYFTAFDVLADQLPAYPLSLGGPGLVRAFSYAGAAPGAISGMFNGRALGGPSGRAYDLELYPMEFLERLEILRGARAAVLGSGESLIGLNFIQPRYNVEGSYVRLWYAQGRYNTSNADITYARNVGDRTNLSLGFRRLGSDGVITNLATANQKVSGWSGRGSVRWDPSENLSIALTEIFSDATRGLNGGLPLTSSREPLLLDVNNDTLQERTLRHDVTLSARWYPRSITRDIADTTADTTLPAIIADTVLRVDGNLYYSYAERELQVGTRRAIMNGALQQNDIIGARAGFTIPLEPMQLQANGMLEYGDNGVLRYEGGGLLELMLTNLLTLRGGAKLHGRGDEVFATITGEGVIGIGDALSVRGTFRGTTLAGTDRVCLLISGGNVNIPANYYTGSLLEGALQWQEGRLRVDVEGFIRNAVPYCPDLASYVVPGGSVYTRIPYEFLTMENRLVATFSGEKFHGQPRLHGTSNLFAQLKMFGGNLDLRLGTTLEYMTSPPIVEYWEGIGEFAVAADSVLPTAPPFPVWTAYAQARIGTAYVRVEMYNILDNLFFTTYRHPVFRRAVNLSVNWALID